MASAAEEETYDAFLGQLIFSPNDPADDILSNIDTAADEGFRKWLDNRIKGTADLEERAALRSLLDLVNKIVAKVEEAAALAPPEVAMQEDAGTGGAIEAEFTEVSPASTPRTAAEVLSEVRRMQGIDAAPIQEGQDGGEEQVPMSPSGIPLAVRRSYEQVIRSILERSAGNSFDEAIDENYNKVDKQFLEILLEMVDEARAGESEWSEEVLIQIRDGVNMAMQRRVQQTTERLQKILTSGPPPAMEKTIAEMAKSGEVDDALVLLMEANAMQAEKAGSPAAQVMRRLAQCVQKELDAKVEPEKKLLRQLLRAEGPEERKELFKIAFRPKAKLALPGGGETSEMPDVQPPAFIKLLMNLKLNFGNIGVSEKEFSAKVEDMILEAEAVATEFFGESIDAREQQDRMWKDGGVSVFDLEKMEDEALMRGEQAPWANDAYDDMLPGLKKGPGEGEFLIGGG
jgi:hypothetical protein